MEDGSAAVGMRLSLNTATVRGTPLADVIDACGRAGVGWIAPWREDYASTSPTVAARWLRDAGLRVSSLCRGGFFPAMHAAARRERIEDTLRAIDEAATLGANVLVLVCGGLNGCDLSSARAMVEDGIAAVMDHAERCGVTLGIEPLHPMFAADRSVIVTLRQAVSLAARLDHPRVGVIVDAYHVWWDPDVDAALKAAAGCIVGFHVDDWIVPLPDVLAGRGMMGDGVIDLRGLRRGVDQAGYCGPIEVEILNEALWTEPVDVTLPRLRERFIATVLDP